VHKNGAGVVAVLTEGNTMHQSTGDGPAMMNRSGGELELSCGVDRVGRGKAWAMNGTGGRRRCPWCLL
jgi:hypothetical protein